MQRCWCAAPIAAIGILIAPMCALAGSSTQSGTVEAKNAGEGDPTAQVESFLKKHAGKSGLETVDVCAARADEAAEGIDEWSSRFWKTLAQFNVAASNPADAKKSNFKPNKPVKGHADDEARKWPNPQLVLYRFGTRDLTCLDSDAKDLVTALKKNEVVTVKQLPAAQRLSNLMRGSRSDLELIVAGIERRLDIHREYDLYGQFLESWRNYGPSGDESFYEALDRTAGSSDAVFFYDSMLGDFVGRFAGTDGKTWSLQVRHDRNQESFLSYRQYRGLIEAVAYSLALPSDVPLPKRLARYDHLALGAGVYTLRDQIDLLLAHEQGDVGAVLDRVRKHLESTPPPTHLWDEYPISDSFLGYFQQLVPEISTQMTGAKSTDELLEQTRLRRIGIAKAVHDAVAPHIVGS